MDELADGTFTRRMVRDFPQRDRQVVEIDCEASISDAFGTLLTHNILCAPVWDATQQGYLGFFDIDDALNISYDIDLLGGKTKAEATRMRTSAVKVLDVFVKANMIRNPSMEAPWIAVGPNVPMRDVIPVLAFQARRVPVVDAASGKCVKLLSQMDVVRQLHAAVQTTREKDLPSFLSLSPAETGLGLKPVLVVTEDDEARDAFRAIIDNAVSAVGVVDEQGKLAGCISNKDIQIVTKGELAGAKKAPVVMAPMMAASTKARPRFSIASGTVGNANFLGMPALMFVHEVRKHMEQGGKTHAVVVAVSPSATFKHIVEKIATSHHHRVFLVDDEYRPVGVISVSDVCKLLAMEMVKPAEAEEQPQAAAGLLVKAPPPVPKRDKQQ